MSLFKGRMASLTYLLVTAATSLFAPTILALATIFAVTLFPSLVIDTTLLTIYFLVACTIYNLFMMLIVSTIRSEEGEDIAHYFSLIIPARNESQVLPETINCVFKMDYPIELYEVVIVNDGSIDDTEQIVRKAQENHANLRLINIPKDKSGRGKGAALNTAFADFLLTWRGLEIEPRHRWIIGVFDADAMPDSDMLRTISNEFKNPRVGGVQTIVRIGNRNESFLSKLQDIEFISFSRVLQFSRASFGGSVALGGNGQFIRATALDTIARKDQEEYWNENSLTEDLEMGMHLITEKWENRYVGTTAVNQEGVENLASLISQRTRWAWGTLQAIRRYVINLRIWRSRISLKKKLDISIYLINILVPFLVLLCWLWSALGLFGIVRISNAFPWIFTVANGFSFVPLYFYGLWKERAEYPLRQIVPLSIAAAIYTYHWIPCITLATAKAILGKPLWTKTPRFNHTPTAHIG
jgi:cellulose synthase/poly-beta-1,6-N-acetylglucosamine synthase-like glycosyltransferase